MVHNPQVPVTEDADKDDEDMVINFMYRESRVSFLLLTPEKHPWCEEPTAFLSPFAPLISTLGN